MRPWRFQRVDRIGFRRHGLASLGYSAASAAPPSGFLRSGATAGRHIVGRKTRLIRCDGFRSQDERIPLRGHYVATGAEKEAREIRFITSRGP
jgi:hypothetical protein